MHLLPELLVDDPNFSLDVLDEVAAHHLLLEGHFHVLIVLAGQSFEGEDEVQESLVPLGQFSGIELPLAVCLELG